MQVTSKPEGNLASCLPLSSVDFAA